MKRLNLNQQSLVHNCSYVCAFCVYLLW